MRNANRLVPLLVLSVVLACSGQGREKIADARMQPDSSVLADLPGTLEDLVADPGPTMPEVAPTDLPPPPDGADVPSDQVAPPPDVHPADVALQDSVEPLPPGCCETDADCDGELVCAWVGEDGPGEPGVCMPPLVAGECFTDADCPEEAVCEGAGFCPCGMDCMWSGPGQCVGPVEYPCCAADADCPEGQFCLLVEPGPLGPGECVDLLQFGQCYTDADCYPETQSCQGATWCPCGALCSAATTPGACGPLPPGCCHTDADCPEYHLCKAVMEEDKLPGVCKVDPNAMDGCMPPDICCWDHADCPEGLQCVGASVCPCIQLCPVCGDCQEDKMGSCQ